MSTVFMGTSEFAAGILRRLAQSDAHRPVLALTRPDRPRGRGRRTLAPPVARCAQELGIALAQPDSVNDEASRELIAHAGDGDGGQPRRQTVVVCAFGALIKEPLLSEHEILNVHPSLLPRWRGAAPIERAIMAGDADTGVSIMRLTAGLDSGPVCLAASEPIAAQATYETLSQRLQTLGGELIVRALDERPPFVEQADDAGVTYAEKIGPADRLLDPGRAAAELERVVRALHPHVGARVQLADETMLGVVRAAVVDEPPDQDLASAEPGQGLEPRDGRLLLHCSPGTLELTQVQPPGGRAMDAAAYLRGHQLPGRR
jgi:methionyl-tRNA formyltransferase